MRLALVSQKFICLYLLRASINSELHHGWQSTILERAYSAFTEPSLYVRLKTHVWEYCLKGQIFGKCVGKLKFFRSCPRHLVGMYIVQEEGWDLAFVTSKLRHECNFHSSECFIFIFYVRKLGLTGLKFLYQFPKLIAD